LGCAFNFDGDDASVTDAAIYLVDSIPIDDQPVVLENPLKVKQHRVQFQGKGRVACIQVVAEDYTGLSVTVQSDGGTYTTTGTLSNAPFPIPRSSFSPVMNTTWTVSISCSDRDAVESRIRSIHIYPEVTRMVQDGVIYCAQDRVPEWMYTWWQFPKVTQVGSYLIRATASQTLTVWTNQVGSTARTFSITSTSGETAVDSLLVSGFAFNLSGDPTTVLDATIFAMDPIPISDAPVILDNPNHLVNHVLRFPGEGRIACVQVLADDYFGMTVTVSNANGLLCTNTSVTDQPFVVPRSALAPVMDARWTVSVTYTTRDSGASRVKSIGVYPEVVRDVQNGIIQCLTVANVPEWMYTWWQFPKYMQVGSYSANASSQVTMNVYMNRLGIVPVAKTITAGLQETAAEGLAGTGCALEFSGAANLVSDVSIFLLDPVPISDSPILMDNPAKLRNHRFQFPGDGRLACLRILADSYEGMTVTVTADGGSYTTSSVTDQPFLVPHSSFSPGLNPVWTVDVAYSSLTLEEAGRVQAIHVYPEITRLVQDPVIWVSGAAPVPEWMYTWYQFPQFSWIGSYLVRADAQVAMDLYLDRNSNTPAGQYTVAATAGETALTNIRAAGCAIAFPSSYGAVQDLALYLVDPMPIQDTPVVLDNPQKLLRHGFKFPNEGRLAAIQIIADGYSGMSVTVTNSSGSIVYTKSPVTDAPFIVPRSTWSAALDSVWYVSIIAGNRDSEASRVRAIHVYPEVVQEVTEGNIYQMREARVPEWMYTWWQFPKPTVIGSYVVRSLTTVTMRMYHSYSGSTATSYASVGGTAGEQRLTPEVTTHGFAVDFSGSEMSVSEFGVYPLEVVPVPNTGLSFLQGQPGQPWRNKMLSFPESGTWSSARVLADSYANGVTVSLKPTQSTNANYVYSVVLDAADNSNDVLLASTSRCIAKDWRLDVYPTTPGDLTVRELVIIAEETFPVTDGLVRIVRSNDLWSWLDRRILADRLVGFTCGRVVAEGDVTLTLVDIDNAANNWTKTVSNGRAFRLPVLKPSRRWRLDVTSDDQGTETMNLVQEVLLATSMARLDVKEQE